MAWVIFFMVAAFILLLLALHWTWNRGLYGKVAMAVILVFSGYATYQTVYPSDAYYRAEFERIAQASFPSGGKILFSDTTTSAHSYYRSCAVIAVSEDEYSALKQTAGNWREENFERAPNNCLAQIERRRRAPVAFTAQNWTASREGNFSQWGLIDDGQSLVYFTMRWKNLNPV